jgi:hypothetical protein
MDQILSVRPPPKMIIQSSRTVLLELSALIAPQMGCQKDPHVHGRRHRLPPLHRPRDRHMQRPPFLYYPSMTTDRLQFCKILTHFSIVPLSSYSSWKWRKDIGHHLCMHVNFISNFLIMATLLSRTITPPSFMLSSHALCPPL